ncbi:MAG: transcription elongation factor GreA [Proteobacteria bacterium]|nr:transcription elongation factor GreA [Pseudomonadota bacterium]MBU1740321.1 transcription elongation factor GreA [Pseudomonadota bacterium]
MTTRYPITEAGLARLKAELERLINQERPRVVKAIAEARAHGDLSENAEYHAAKERQSFVEGKINELQRQIASSEVFRSEGANGRVVFESFVKVEDLDTAEVSTYRLVGPFESDAGQGHLSVISPIGRALIGKSEGDEIKVQTPGGVKELEIVKVW